MRGKSKFWNSRNFHLQLAKLWARSTRQWDHVPITCSTSFLMTFFTALKWSQTVRHASLFNLLKLVFSTLDGDEQFKAEDGGHFWSYFIQKSEGKFQWLRETGFKLYKCANSWWHTIWSREIGGLIFGQRCAKLKAWIEGMFDFGYLGRGKVPFALAASYWRTILVVCVGLRCSNWENEI